MKGINNFKILIAKVYRLLDQRQRRNFLIIIILMIICSALAQFTPKAIGYLTDDILANKDIVFISVIPVLILILAANVLNEALKIIRRLMVEDAATKTEQKAREQVVVALLKAPLNYFKQHMTGNIHGRLNRCLEGTVKLEKLLFMDLVPAIFNSLAAIIVIFTTLPIILALPMMLVIPIGLFIVYRQISTQRGIRVELLETKAGIDGTIVELLNGIEVIRISDSVELEKQRFADKSYYLRKKEMKHHYQMAKYDILKFINEAVFTVLMIGISVYLATINVISVGNVLTAYLCFAQLIKPLEELHRIFDELAECVVLSEDFFKMLELPCDFSYLPSQPQDLTKIAKPLISVDDISFSYDDGTKVLDGISFTVDEGKFIGIVGPSGCGKSTLIKLICNLENSHERAKIGFWPISRLSRHDLAAMIALVPQNPFLIAGTIRDNICYGLAQKVDDAEILAAAKKAYLLSFIAELPDGLDTVIAEGGSNLSGGQRQRIAIARIFLRTPKILILDEATSALDNTAEKYIQREIEKLIKEHNLTVLSIAHRLTTLENCDEIIVFDDGKIVQRGKYHELIEAKGIFSDMYHGRII